MKKKNKKLLEFITAMIVILGFFIYDEYIENYLKDSSHKTELRESSTTKQTLSLKDSNFAIYFIDVGQADCILIENNGEYALVDAGNNEDETKLVEYFTNLGISSFKYVFGTHAHEDHIGGIDDIIDNFSVENFFMPDVVTTTKTFEDVLNSLEKKNIAFQIPEIDSTFSLADTKFQVLYIGSSKDDLNDTSIVLKVTYKDISILLTGDATTKVEKEIINKNLKSDVLKVAHHGSQYSSHAEFLKKVSPKYAIIQVGKNNSYNHPKDITIKKLEKLGVEIYRTDRDGTIILKSDGTNIEIKKENTDTNG